MQAVAHLFAGRMGVALVVTHCEQGFFDVASGQGEDLYMPQQRDNVIAHDAILAVISRWLDEHTGRRQPLLDGITDGFVNWTPLTNIVEIVSIQILH